jgi:hypothetical protein
MENTWIRIRDGERKEYALGHRLYSAAELMDLAIQAGFESVVAHGALDGSPYDEKASRLIVVARKGEAVA